MIDVELLRQEELIGMINDFEVDNNLQLTASGILPVANGMGDNKSWDINVVQRDIDTFEGKYSPAGVRKMKYVKNRTAKLIKTFKSTPIPGQILMDLREPGTTRRQTVAQDRIAEELQELNNLIDRQDEFLIAKALQDDLDVTIDDIAHTVDYAFPAAHKNLTIGGGGNNVATDWFDSGADIVHDIRKWKQAIAEDSGFTPTTVWCSDEIIECLIKNDFVGQYFASTPAGGEFLREGVISRFMGLNWKPYMNTYVDSDGNVQRYIPKSDLIMVPAPSKSWGEFWVGSDVIPTDDKNGMHEVQGKYSYSELVTNPPSIALFLGKVRLPIIKKPNALLVARVTASF